MKHFFMTIKAGEIVNECMCNGVDCTEEQENAMENARLAWRRSEFEQGQKLWNDLVAERLDVEALKSGELLKVIVTLSKFMRSANHLSDEEMAQNEYTVDTFVDIGMTLAELVLLYNDIQYNCYE